MNETCWIWEAVKTYNIALTELCLQNYLQKYMFVTPSLLNEYIDCINPTTNDNVVEA